MFAFVSAVTTVSNDPVSNGGSILVVIISRCSKLIAYMNLIKKVMLSNASTPSFGPYAQLSSVV